ncbi:2-C-methyl-D-erythritol 2,4-cyclodiphosphate synthase [Candidatus Woesearchaeota archaeon CG_4_10_14_0_2_um_filter_33_10]|nr:MAG: 2-C-methyl-D-erythritol 2,4-cyclodiphosphate synthase [Candidatus Woesearchaeota archaeon CG06_land_8_20_14_3_00_33_13]PIZ53821.1 MAG: 2-C-methyl-D-erythritol 2,4-cyclodiphosphate synthase [Candidatus Woesearchaeota archaeon CG_4_10_14_0_2_um_filter_33_10]
MIRVGIGQDSHRFIRKSKKRLALGGVIIHDEKGLEGNSDGDVVLHAIFNALSQAVGKRSIGFYSDKMCREGIKDSREYLKLALKMVKDSGYKVNNIGVMIEAKKPRIEPYVDDMKKSIARILMITQNMVGITATSGEGLTAFGKGMGIQVFAIATVVRC